MTTKLDLTLLVVVSTYTYIHHTYTFYNIKRNTRVEFIVKCLDGCLKIFFLLTDENRNVLGINIETRSEEFNSMFYI